MSDWLRGHTTVDAHGATAASAGRFFFSVASADSRTADASGFRDRAPLRLRRLLLRFEEGFLKGGGVACWSFFVSLALIRFIMGNRFSRRRDAPANSAEGAATEQKPAEEPAAAPPAEESSMAQTQEAVVETAHVEKVAEKPETLEPSLPSEECVSECKEVNVPATASSVSDPEPEPEPVVEETPAPVTPEPVVSVSQPSSPEPEPVAEPQLAPEPTPVPVAEPQLAPEPTPVPVPEPEPTSSSEADLVPEPVAESAEALEQQTDIVAQEPLPEPEISSAPLIDLGIPDATPAPTDTPSFSINADEASDIPVSEECQNSAEVLVTSSVESEKSEETSESLEKSTEVEAEENMEQIVSDVNEESVRGLLQNLELKGSDLDTDLIPTDASIPDDAPITDLSASTESM
ncbi:uncharacterized protein V6R79_012539 [Siganus canaliculatus]